MSYLDWGVFLLFIAYVVWDGVRRGAESRDLEGYFAGGRQIPWWAAGLSVMATQASAITIIGTTGQGHENGMEFVQTYLGLPLAMVLLCIFFIPLYRKNPVLTAYQYLETRFGPETRTLASLIFMVSRCLAFGVVLYAPAVVISAMTGLSLTVTVVVIGILTTGYTLFGGMRAVVWTDVKQMVVIIGGLFLTLGILLYKILPEFSFDGALTVLGAAGKLNALELEPSSWNLWPAWKGSTAPATFWDDRYNLWSGLFGGLFLMLSYFGCDQIQVQRYLSVNTADDSRRTLLLSAYAKIPMQALVLLLGVLLYLHNVMGEPPLLYNPVDREVAATGAHLDRVEELELQYRQLLGQQRALAHQIAVADQIDDSLLDSYQQVIRDVAATRSAARQEVGAGGDTNYVYPHFILNEIPPVLLGLLIAGIFAAAMSSADSALNSLTAACIVDLYKRWLNPSASDQRSLRMSRIVTGFWGAAATYAALQFQGQGSIIELVNRVGSFFYGSLLGVFAMALLLPRAGRRAGFWGLVGGMASVLLVHNLFRVEFLWYNVVGCLGVLTVGWVVSHFETR